VLKVFAPAKVNLHLAVGRLREDGYHELTGVFHALELADEVSLEPAESLELMCDADLGIEPEDNIALRAAVAMGREFGRAPLVRIGLMKRVPHGAGLGGGSSDAAAVIAGLATMWNAETTDVRCVAAAAGVGADVPFFLVPGGAALMTGRGDRVARELVPLGGTPVVLVRPPLPVSTAAAYRAFDAAPVAAEEPDAAIAALETGDVTALGRALANNLEAASAAVVPEVADALAWTRTATGVLGAAVAGSGSAVFAIVESDHAAAAIARAAEDRGWWSAATRLGASGVRVDHDTGGVE